MYNSNSKIRLPWNVEAKISKAKRKPNFNDEELDVNTSHNQTQNLNLDHLQITCQNHHGTAVLTTQVRSTGGWSRLRKEDWLRREPRDNRRISSSGL